MTTNENEDLPKSFTIFFDDILDIRADTCEEIFVATVCDSIDGDFCYDIFPGMTYLT